MPFQIQSYGGHGERVSFSSSLPTDALGQNKAEKVKLTLTPTSGKRLKEIIIETLWNLEGLYPGFVFAFPDNPQFANNIPLPSAIGGQLVDNITTGLLVNCDFINSPTRRIRLDLKDCANLVIYNVSDRNTPSQVIFDFVMEG